MHGVSVGQPIQVSEETSRWQAERSDGRKPEDLRVYTRDYGSIVRQRVDEGMSDPEYGVEDTDPEGNVDLYDSETQLPMTPASFKRLIRCYGLVPITAAFTILFFTLIRYFLWPGPSGPPSPFALHLSMTMLGAAVWTVTFALRVPIYLLSSLICNMHTFTPFVSASSQVFVEESIRLSSLLLVHLHTRDNSSLSPEDTAFSRVWTLALGWAAAEVAVSVYQGYGQLLLYSDLISPDNPAWSYHTRLPYPIEGRFFHDPEFILDEETDLVVRLRARTELEALYGIPVPDIPVFVSCLLRIDSITLSVALFLIVSSSYLSYLSQSPPAEQDFLQAIRHTIPTFLIIFMLRTILSFTWTLNILPRIGFHAASYMSCMFALGALFVGLGRWDAV